MKCSNCDNEMAHGALYLRGFAGSLAWSTNQEVGFLSKKDLQQINLGKLSMTGSAATQAIIESWRCQSCDLVSFQTKGCFMNDAAS